jgi:glycerol-3-phosphate dehydrogenase (NAD(P)+)
MGLALAAGKTIEEAQEEIQQVVEGVLAAKAVKGVAERLNVDMPICLSIYRILYEGLPPREAVATLMNRALKPEATS